MPCYYLSLKKKNYLLYWYNSANTDVSYECAVPCYYLSLTYGPSTAALHSCAQALQLDLQRDAGGVLEGGGGMKDEGERPEEREERNAHVIYIYIYIYYVS